MVDQALIHKLNTIRMLIMDVDGTLTDGRIIIDDNGVESKSFNVKDGMGIIELKKVGVIPVVITGRKSQCVSIRCNELGIKDLYQGVENKKEIMPVLQQLYGISSDLIAYVGDDINDRGILESCGVKFAVNDATPSITEMADYVTERNGGEGAIREISDLILRYKDLR